MFKKRLGTIVTIIAVFSMIFAVTPASALGTRHTVKGNVVAINTRTQVMSVKDSTGTKISLSYNTKTRLTIRGKKSSISSLHVGDKVTVTYTASSGPVSGVATNCQDTPGSYDLQGTVSATDTTANTLTVATDEGGSAVTFNVDSTTVITLDGAPATLADLVFGQSVDVTYDSTTMLASSIVAETNTESAEIEGTISAVDTTAGTVTITPEEGGADVVLNTDSTTVIMLDDSPAALTDLQVGFQIEAEYDATTMLASFVDAESAED